MDTYVIASAASAWGGMGKLVLGGWYVILLEDCVLLLCIFATATVMSSVFLPKLANKRRYFPTWKVTKSAPCSFYTLQ